MYKLNLDYTIQWSDERIDLVNERIEELKLESTFSRASTQAACESMANYILYSDDLRWQIRDKQFTIDPAKKTQARRKDESLEAFIEQTNGEPYEANMHPLGTKNIYTNPKPKITEDDIDKVPTLLELRNTIQQFERVISEAKLARSDPSNPSWRPGIELWRLSHWLIELRQQQYALKDLFVKPIRFQNITRTKAGRIKFDLDTGYAKATSWDDPEWEWVNLGSTHIDLANPTHLYHIFENYSRLKQDSWDDLDSDIKYILEDLDAISHRALRDAPIHDYILLRKVDGATNDRIREELQEKFNVSYNSDYISLLYKHKICDKIAQTAELMYDEWLARDNPKAWKRCSTCRELKLKDARNYVRKSVNFDGFSARCKVCDRAARQN